MSNRNLLFSHRLAQFKFLIDIHLTSKQANCGIVVLFLPLSSSIYMCVCHNFWQAYELKNANYTRSTRALIIRCGWEDMWYFKKMLTLNVGQCGSKKRDKTFFFSNDDDSFVFVCLQGICPGNRLKLIPAHDSGCYSPSPLSSPCPSMGTISAATTPTATTPSSDFYENTSLSLMQKLGKRRSWHIMPNRVSEGTFL